MIFGAHAGYSQQFESDLVLGLKASIDGTSLIRREGIGASDLAGDQATLTSMVQSDIQGSLRGRAGYAFGRLLPYVTGGLAIGHFGTQSDFAAANNANIAFDGFATHGLQWTTRLGWTVGGGAEWAVNDNWSIRGEYRYSEFGSVSDSRPSRFRGPITAADAGSIRTSSRSARATNSAIRCSCRLRRLCWPPRRRRSTGRDTAGPVSTPAVRWA